MLYSATDSQGRSHTHPQWRDTTPTSSSDLNTFGFDYVRLTDPQVTPQALTFAASKHDTVIGTKAVWPSAGVDYNDTETATILRAENPSVEVIKYIPYHSMSYFTAQWLEAWCLASGHNIVDLYMHYAVDTVVRISGDTDSNNESAVTGVEFNTTAAVLFNRDTQIPAGAKINFTRLTGADHPINNAQFVALPDPADNRRITLYTDTLPPAPVDSTAWPALAGTWSYATNNFVAAANRHEVTVPGVGGWAPNQADSRARVRWNGGWLAINPGSQTWRLAYEALCAYLITEQSTPAQYAHGLLLDTFEGLAEQNDLAYTSRIENTVEYAAHPNKAAVYAALEADLVAASSALKNAMAALSGNPAFRVIPNGAEYDYFYDQFSSLYEGNKAVLDDVCIEYAGSSLTRARYIDRMQSVYNDMDAGRRFLLRMETRTVQPVDRAFSLFLLGLIYLLKHDNASFMYHHGGAGNYGGNPYGDMTQTHWHANLEVSLGAALVRGGSDFWGAANTDRFYIFASDVDGTVYARDYDNALVLVRLGNVSGAANIGLQPNTLPLGGVFYPLQADNTAQMQVNSVVLGNTNGAILMRSAV